MTTSSSTISASDDVALPTRCPSWCYSGPAGHRQAYDEGCPQEDARLHSSGDVIGLTTDLLGNRWRWDACLFADPGDDCHSYGVPYIELETHMVYDKPTDAHRHVWRLDSGAARVLARQLLHFADAADLES